MNIRASVVGAAGFAGIELVRLLLRHPDFELASVTSDALAGTPVSQAYPAFAGQTDLVFSACDDAAFDGCDVAFLAVPHTASLGMAPGLLARGVSVIDLSADFRLKDPAVYERWYKTPHTASRLLPEAAFGLPELARGELERAAAARAEGRRRSWPVRDATPRQPRWPPRPPWQAGWWTRRASWWWTRCRA